MKFVELKKSLMNIQPFYVLQGEDEYLIKHSIFLIKNKVVTDFVEMNELVLDLSEAVNVDMVEVLTTLPFCADKRLVVLKNAVVDDRLAQTLVKCKNEYTVVVLSKPDLRAKIDACVVDCDPLDSITLSKWVVQYVSNRDVAITTKAIDLLGEICSNKLELIEPELEKLCAYAMHTKKIDEASVNSLVIKTENYFSYNLTSAYEQGNINELARILDNLVKKDSAQQVFASLGSYFRRMFYCAVTTDSDEAVAKCLGIKSYAVKKSRQVIAREKNKDKFEADYQLFVALDSQIKQGKISPLNALYTLLLK